MTDRYLEDKFRSERNNARGSQVRLAYDAFVHPTLRTLSLSSRALGTGSFLVRHVLCLLRVKKLGAFLSIMQIALQ